MENAILKHNTHWQKRYSNLLKRNILDSIIEKLYLRQIEVIKGIRRSGKTSLFKLIINHLIDSNVDAKSILYINFDDPYFTEICSDSKNIYRLLELSEKITETKVDYLFLDEIQNVKDWEKFVKVIYDNESVKKIFITGSNASLLDGEYAILLSGRYLQDEVMPLSFSEVLKYFDITNKLKLLENKAKVLKIVEDLMQYGGFYEVVKEPKFKREILINYYETIILKDCIAQHNIRDIKGFKEIAYFIISNATNLYSYNSLARAINSNDNTIKQYLQILEDSYLLKELQQYSYKLKEQIKSKKKIYINDNGLLAQISFSFSKNFGKLFENLVYTELRKQNYEIYFYNKDYECDFIAVKNQEIIAVQVCYQLNKQNMEREVGALRKLKFNVDKKILITFNDESQKIDDIEIIPFWDYFF
ncbi:MAG: ATP-binding protein [Epsilonproteobacteria bacterium]|nr:ATP-binding protein [Campylobacterota bacterium]